MKISENAFKTKVLNFFIVRYKGIRVPFENITSQKQRSFIPLWSLYTACQSYRDKSFVIESCSCRHLFVITRWQCKVDYLPNNNLEQSRKFDVRRYIHTCIIPKAFQRTTKIRAGVYYVNILRPRKSNSRSARKLKKAEINDRENFNAISSHYCTQEIRIPTTV